MGLREANLGHPVCSRQSLVMLGRVALLGRVSQHFRCVHQLLIVILAAYRVGCHDRVGTRELPVGGVVAHIDNDLADRFDLLKFGEDVTASSYQ